MTKADIDKKKTPPTQLNGLNSFIDLIIVFAVSVFAFLAERMLDRTELVSIPPAATGFTAVIAGCLTAVALFFVRRQSFSEIGFRKPKRWVTVPIWVIGIFLAFVVAQLAVPAILRIYIDLPKADLSRYDSLYQNLPAVIMMALVLPLTASIPEEIIYRGFLMDRLTRIFGADLPGTVLTVGVQSFIFGAIHFQWGVGGMISTFVMGVVWGTAFLLVGRNLWIVIMAHSLGHVVMVIQLYFVKASEMGS